MNTLAKVLVTTLFVCGASTSNAASVSNFQSVYDVANGRIQYTFDLNPNGGNTPAGVDSIYFNYNPQTPPNPFINSTVLLDSTISGFALGGIFDIDELFVKFNTLTTLTSISFILGGVDAASVLAPPSYTLELYANPNFSVQCCYNSTLGMEYLGVVETQATQGNVPSSFARVPEPSTLALLGLGFAGLGALRRKQKSA